MRLIDGEALYKQVAESEEKARDRFLDASSSLPCPTYINPAYTRYNEQLNERTRLKHVIADAPTIDAVQVVRCKDCKHYKVKIDCVGGKYSGCDVWTDNGNECYVEPNWYCSFGERGESE